MSDQQEEEPSPHVPDATQQSDVNQAPNNGVHSANVSSSASSDTGIAVVDSSVLSEKQRKALEIAQRLAAKTGQKLTQTQDSNNASPNTLLGKRKQSTGVVDVAVYRHHESIPLVSTGINADVVQWFNIDTIHKLEFKTDSRIELLGSSNDVDSIDPYHIVVYSKSASSLSAALSLLTECVYNQQTRNDILAPQPDPTAHVLTSSIYDSALEQPVSKQQKLDVSDGSGSQTILVDNERVGLVIGRGGETIKALQEQTQCHISIEKTPTAQGKRIVTLTGTPAQIQHAEQQIHYRMQGGRPDYTSSSTQPVNNDQSYQASTAPHAPSSASNYHGMSDRQEIIAVPNDVVGILIGKGGETIRSMQAGSGANIQIQKESDRDRSTDQRLITLAGTPQQRETAKQLIDMHITQFINKNNGVIPSPPNQAAQHSQSTSSSGSQIIRVPNSVVGSIIGKQGETIKRLQSGTGARIQISKDDSQPEREITLTGSHQDIQRAQMEIDVVVQQRLQAIGQTGGVQIGANPARQPYNAYAPQLYSQQTYAAPTQQTYQQQTYSGYQPPYQAPYQQSYNQAPYGQSATYQPGPSQQSATYDSNQYANYYAQMVYQPEATVPPGQNVSPVTANPVPASTGTSDANADYYNTPEYQAYLAQYYASLAQQTGNTGQQQQQQQQQQYYQPT